MSIWEKLSSIDVSDRIEKKGNLSYLSWAWAWGKLKEFYPESHYSFREPVFFPDGSVEVWVDMTVVDGDKKLTHEMWLPVMDNRNNSIQNPDARKISDTRMRCLVKAIAMFGLGHYIYAGEDLPGDDHQPIRKPATASNDKPWYNDFDNQKGMMLQKIQSGEQTSAGIIAALSKKFKINAKVREQITNLEKQQ